MRKTLQIIFFGDKFGSSISLSNDGLTLAVGTYPLNTANDWTFEKYVKVYTYDGTNWNLKGSKISLPNNLEGNSILNVELNGDGSILAVGSEFLPSLNDNSGLVEVYEFSSNEWNLKGSRISPLVGSTVALNDDGNILITGWREGPVKSYIFQNGTWDQYAPDISYDDGNSIGGVDISSDASIIAIGSPNNDDAGLNYGQVKVFD